MTDRELLELAAKAAGYSEDHIYPGHGCGLTLFEEEESTCGNGTQWNPLEDDGDALRLAVKLRFSIDCDDYANMVMVYTEAGERSFDECIKDADPYSATRRAIVRAAAAL